MVSNQEENYTSKEPKEIVKELALMKANHVAFELGGQKGINAKNLSLANNEEVIIIGADTIVVAAGQVLEKPEDKKEAFWMISRLQDNGHQVFTGVAILKGTELKNLKRTNFVVETKVYVSQMTDDEIWSYIETGESFDKAGGYGIQGGFAKFIEKIEGDFYNVMGLPVSRLYEEIKKLF
jgi:septum formation protein